MIYLMATGIPRPGATHEEAVGGAFTFWVNTNDRGAAVAKAHEELAKEGWDIQSIDALDAVDLRDYRWNRKARKKFREALAEGFSYAAFFWE